MKTKRNQAVLDGEFIDLRPLIEERVQLLEGVMDELRPRIARAPEGKLHSVRHGKSFQYYIRTLAGQTNGRYLRKEETGLVQALAQKGYDAALLRKIEQEHRLLTQYLKRFPSEPLRASEGLIPKAEQTFVKPVFLNDDDYVRQWLSFPYAGRGFSDDTPVYLTKNNERVRSKSEILIANALSDLGVPYRYECPLTLGNRTIHPDFTALNVRRRKTYYIEHLGLMTDPDYCEHALEKISRYEAAGIYPGEQLILFHETQLHPLDIRLMNQLLRHYLL